MALCIEEDERGLATRRSLFSKPKNSTKFKIREGLKLHLYTSAAPCGAASLHQVQGAGREEKKGSLMAKGTFGASDGADMPQGALALGRAGVAEGGGCSRISSTLAVEKGTGRTLSCSDKITKWLALGVQGSLLSRVMSPLYLESVTIGTPTPTLAVTLIPNPDFVSRKKVLLRTV